MLAAGVREPQEEKDKIYGQEFRATATEYGCLPRSLVVTPFEAEPDRVLFDTLLVPEALLIAQQEGRLVVFAGAGVSMEPPAKLPSFGKLTELIARRALRPNERLKLDHLLGELQEEGRDVHAEAARILGRASKSNQLHELLLRIFPRREDVRAVTTNFDPHFQTVGERLYPGLPVFTAPALPRGGDFHGLVQMHGAVRGIATDMVLTDRDFGRAYLTEGWARTFLEQMFARYTVVFVGYSHTDPPVHYIARGLPTEKEKRRFVITNENPGRWEKLGVHVIPFKARPGQRRFVPLNRGIAEWVAVTRGSNFALEDRIVGILGRPDPSALPPSDAELLAWCLGQDHTVIYFTRNARGLAWVDWLASRRLLAPFFDPKTESVYARQRQVAAWLAEQLVQGPKERAFGIVRSQGSRFSNDLYFWLRHRMDEEDVSHEWALLLAPHADMGDTDAIYSFGQMLRTLGHTEAAAFWPLWTHFTTPWLELDPVGLDAFGGDAKARVALTGLAGELWSVWGEVVRPRFDRQGLRMLGVLLEKWERARELATALGDFEALHRRATDGRRRIVARNYHHHHGRHPSALVDMLVDLSRYLARQPGLLPAAQITGWLDSPDGVLRRLGLIALAESVDIPAAGKEGAVRQRVAVYSADSRELREAQDLLAELAQPAVLTGTVANALIFPPVPETLPPVAELLRMSDAERARVFHFVRLTPAIVLAALHDLDAATVADPAILGHPLWDHVLFFSSWRRLDSAGRDELSLVAGRPGFISHHALPVLHSFFRDDPLEGEGSTAPTAQQVDTLFTLSQTLWGVLGDTNMVEEPTDFAQADWISLALSHGIYHLVQFWLRYLSLQPVDVTSPALPAPVAALWEDVLARNSGTARRGRAVLLQDTGFVMVRDPAWTRERLLPRFDFAILDNEAWVAWRPFLEHGRMNRPLALAMTPIYRASEPRILGAGDKVIGHYLQDVSRILVHVFSAAASGWPEQLLNAVAEDDRLRWGRLVGRELAGLTDEQQAGLWENWLGDYWQQRRAGRLGTRTLPVTAGEAAIMAGWLPSLPAKFPEAFALVLAGQQFDFGQERFDWRELRGSAVPVRHPVEFLAFVEFLLRHMPPPPMHHESVAEAVGRLPRLAVLRPPLLRIAEQFQTHGWLEARAFKEWIEREFP